MKVVVGRIGRAHGVRGEVTVDVRTDDPASRFAPGSRLDTDPSEPGPLELVSARWHSGRLLASFTGVEDRTAAETLRGAYLLVDTDADEVLDDPDEFYDHQLIGMAATLDGGEQVGEVADVLHLPGQDVLAVRLADGREVLVPFVAQIVTGVDVADGRVRIDPPPGLLDPGSPT